MEINKRILEENLLESEKRQWVSNKQCTIKLCKSKNIYGLEWPNQSPVLNPN